VNKPLLIILRRPPYGSSLSREGIDIALAAAAFGQEVSLLFIADGVWQLLLHQDSEALSIKNHANVLNALELYGISNIYVEARALLERQIESDQIIHSHQLLTSTEISSIIAEHKTVLNF